MKKWLKLLLVLVFFALVSVSIYLILRACGITNIETLQTIVEKSGNFGILVFLIIEILLFTLLCFVPVMNTATIVLGIVLFGAKTAFFTSYIAGFVSASILFFIGDRFGEKLAAKLIGKEELERVQDLVDSKSKILLPLIFLIPGTPDEAVSLVAGMTKMKYWYFALICLLFHGLDDLIVCFLGSGLIDWASLRVFDWLIFINLVVIDIWLLFKIQNTIEKKKQRKDK